MPRRSSSVTSSTFTVPTSLPFFITDGAVAERLHLVDVVVDQEDADALFLQLVDQLGHHPGLFHAQRRGGLVHDQDLGVEIDRAR